MNRNLLAALAIAALFALLPSAALATGNFCAMTTATTGTGTMTLGAALTSYLNFADCGIVNAQVVPYTIVDGNSREIGYGTYTSSGTTLSRDTVLNSTAGGTTKISLSGTAQVFIGPTYEDVYKPSVDFCFKASDEATAITTGTAKITFYFPAAWTVTSVYAGLSAQSTSGNPTFDINEAGTSILGANKLSIDANEDTSATAATATSIADSSIAANAKMTVDFDTAGTGAKGVEICVIGHRT